MTKPKQPGAKLPKPIKAWGIEFKTGTLLAFAWSTRAECLSSSEYWGICNVIPVLISAIPPKPRKVK